LLLPFQFPSSAGDDHVSGIVASGGFARQTNSPPIPIKTNEFARLTLAASLR
jgi:hypothetical protein